MSILNGASMPMGVIDEPPLDDSSDLGFLEYKGANGLCDGDLATADLQPGHLFTIHGDHRMMMNILELEPAQSPRGARTEPAGDRALMSGSQANHDMLRAFRSHAIRA